MAINSTLLTWIIVIIVVKIVLLCIIYYLRHQRRQKRRERGCHCFDEADACCTPLWATSDRFCRCPQNNSRYNLPPAYRAEPDIEMGSNFKGLNAQETAPWQQNIDYKPIPKAHVDDQYRYQ